MGARRAPSPHSSHIRGVSGPAPRIPVSFLSPALRTPVPPEPSHLGATCLSGLYAHEREHMCIVHACHVFLCVHACPSGPRAGAAAPHPATMDRARLTADVRGPPGHAHARFVAGLGVGGHGRAETLTVAPRVAGARVAHAGLVVPGGVDLGAGGVSAQREEPTPSPWAAGSPSARQTPICHLRRARLGTHPGSLGASLTSPLPLLPRLCSATSLNCRPALPVTVL